MPRLSRKEQARRDKISRALRLHYASRRDRSARISLGLKRYWSQVRAIAETEGLSIAQARGVRGGRVIGVAPGIVIPVALFEVFEFPEIFERPLVTEWTPGPEQGEFAFNLRDVNELERIGIPERFRGQRVSADFRLQIFSEGRTRAPEERFLTIEFDGGESDQEFWSNYYEALREEYEGEVETEGMSSTDVGIAVMSMRGS